MSDFDEDLQMYEESGQTSVKQLDSEVLLRPISDLDYPTDPLSVTPDTPVLDALRAMAEKRIGAVPVVDATDAKRLVGIFSERDALRKGLYDLDSDARTSPVSAYMTPDPDCLSPHDTIAHALNRMTEGRYRHIPLKDNGGTLAGLLIMRDVVTYIVSFFPDEVLAVAPHSEHDPPSRVAEGG